MSGLGKGTKSKRRAHFPNDRVLALNPEDVPFMHEMAGGETGFNLASLTTPTGAGSFVNPSPAKVASINLALNKANFELFNSTGEKMRQGLDYELQGVQVIFTTIVAGASDVFFGTIRNAKRSGMEFMSGTQILAMGFLPVGEKDFNVGTPFKWFANPTLRTGQIRVERSRMAQYRNSDNDAVTLDGDYHEVRIGSSDSAIVVRFNDAGAELPDGNLEFVAVYGTTAFVDRENGSLRAEMESQAAQVYRMATDLAVLAAVPVTNYLTANPSQVDLKAFGDNVIDQLARLAVVESIVKDVSMRYSTNTATAILSTGTDVDFEDLDWDTHNAYSGGLYTVQEAGTYQVSANLQLASGTPSNLRIGVKLNGTEVRSRTNIFDATAAAQTLGVSITTELRCLVGDTIGILGRANLGSINLNGSGAYNELMIRRVRDY